MNSEKFFSESSVKSLFIKVAIPGAIGMLFSAIYPIVDGLFITNFISSTAFGASNLVFPFIYILFCIADLIGVGSSVIIAIMLGKKENDKASRLFTSSILIILISEIVLAIIFYFIAPYLIKMMGAEGDLYSLGLEYLRTYIICLPFTGLVFAMDNYLRICGKVKTSMFLNILMSLLIIIIEFIFLGILDLGIFASALASSISFFLCTIFALIPFFKGNLLLKFKKPSINIKEVMLIIKNGGPTFINNIAGRLIGLLFNFLLLKQAGENGVNAYGVLMSLEAFVLPLMYGTCDALQPATGYNYGARKIDRVKKIQTLSFLTGFGICLISFILMISLRSNFAYIYMDENLEGSIDICKKAIFIYAFTYLTRWISYATQSLFASLSLAKESTIISLSISFIIPLILVGCFFSLNVDGIWLNFPITSLIVAIIAIMLLRYKIKKGLFITINDKNIS